MNQIIDAARLKLILNDLRLPAMKHSWPMIAEQSDKEGWPAARFLATLAEHEIAERDRRRIERHLADARLLPGKTLDSFDFNAVPMVDSDNDSVFINETVRDYCAATGTTFTRCRPYRKNDQAWVEQKNGSVVRRLVGYRRFEGLEAASMLAELYAASRLFVNFFQPSFKLAEKQRDGAKVYKRYHAPATPCQRLLDEPRTSEQTRKQLRDTAAGLDPVRLLRDIRTAQQKLVILADAVVSAAPGETAPPPLDAFLSSLKTLWKDGEARPTATAKPPQKRWRRRPDPLIEVTDRLKTWFDKEPWRTGRELLEKLQAEEPGNYPESLLRTVQRRLKGWRSEQARALVFSGTAALASDGKAGAPAMIGVA